MKNQLIATLLILGSTNAFANDHIAYSDSAQEVADNDACVGVATDALIDYLMSKMSDPSDLDTLNVADVQVKSPRKTYVLSASVNGDGNGPTKKYTIDVACSGKVR